MTASKWEKFTDWCKDKNTTPLKGYLTLYPEANKLIQNVSADVKIALVQGYDISLTPSVITYNKEGLSFTERVTERVTMRGVIPYNWIKKLSIINWNI